MIDDPELREILGEIDPTAEKIAAAQAAVSPKAGEGRRAVKVGRLDSLDAIGKEAGKLYRKARQSAGDDISAGTGQKLASVLKLCADLVQAGELARFEEIERRLAELEAERKNR